MMANTLFEQNSSAKHRRQSSPNIPPETEADGILQCKKCLNFIATTKRVEAIYELSSSQIFIALSGGVASSVFATQDPRFSSKTNSANEEKEGSLENQALDTCVFSLLCCKKCNQPCGRIYVATVEQFDSIRMRCLLEEDAIQYLDEESCEIKVLSQITSYPRKILHSTQKSRANSKSNINFNLFTPSSTYNNNNPNYTNTQSRSAESRSNRTSLQSRGVSPLRQQNNPITPDESIAKMEATVEEFNRTLCTFDERIDISESHIERINKRINQLVRIVSQKQHSPKPQQQYQQEHQHFRIDSLQNTTPRMKRTYLDGLSPPRALGSLNNNNGYLVHHHQDFEQDDFDQDHENNQYSQQPRRSR